MKGNKHMKTITNIVYPALVLIGFVCFAEPCGAAPFEFENTGSLATARFWHTATLLPNGKVLVAGGVDADATAELYDPGTGIWTPTGNLVTPRHLHTATLLPNGKVLVAGGTNDNGTSFLSSAELYDPAEGNWVATGSLTTARIWHTATLLTNGNILVAGGFNGSTLASAELYDVGLGFRSDWQSDIASGTARLRLGQRLWLAGSHFQGVSQASGGNTQDSSSNYPIVQLRNLDSSQVAFLPVAPVRGWSNTNFISRPVIDFPSGPALVTVFTNGIPSMAKYLVVSETH
jgi:hypothetical protein